MKALSSTFVMGAILAGSLFAFSGCGLWDANAEFRVDVPPQTFDFNLNADTLIAQLENELNISLQGADELPAGITVTQDMELPAQDMDLSGEEALREHIESGAIKSVTINAVEYTIANNSLTFPLPSVELYMDDLGATEITATATKIAQTEQIDPGYTGTKEVLFVPGGREALSDFLFQLKFTALGKAAVTIDTTGPGPHPVPGGVMDGKVTIHLYFTVDPLEAI